MDSGSTNQQRTDSPGSSSENYEGSTLAIADLSNVHSKLFSARTHWYNLGMALKIDHETLHSIEKLHRGESNECLRDMLAHRLSKSVDLTWTDLCSCLRTDPVGRNDVAEDIEEYIRDLPTPVLDKVATGVKRKTQEDCLKSSCAKKQRVTPTLKKGKIDREKILMDVAWDIGDKWEEVGVALDIDYKVLKSRVGGNSSEPSHLKAFHMLQEWKSRAANSFTYERLASALEEVELNSCAQRYCYSSVSIENEQ